MSEEIKKISLFDAFSQTAQTLEEAEAKAKAEKGVERIEKFTMPDEGEYNVRVLPLCPVINEAGEVIMPMDRRGCDFPVDAMMVEIKGQADKKGKAPKKYAYLVRATQNGVNKSIDLIDEYVRIAKDMYADDDDVMDMLTNSESKERIYWKHQRAMYVLDVSNPDQPKGPLLWTLSNKQYKAIDEERRAVWNKEKTKKNGNPNCGDPLCSIEDAWPLTITKTGSKLTTAYAFKIDRGEDKYPLEEDQLQALYDMSRIPDEIYRFSRYTMEAEIAYLQAYDEKHDLEVCKDEEFLEAIETLKGQLAPDDNSHFSFSGSGNGDKNENKGSDITLESLNEAYDYIVDNNLGKDSDEAQELREDMRQFIEDNQLDVIVKHSKKIKDLLDEIEDAYEEKQNAAPLKDAPVKEEVKEETSVESDDKEEEEEQPVRRPRRRPARQEDEDKEEPVPEVSEDSSQDEEQSAEEEDAPRPRARRRRNV